MDNSYGLVSSTSTKKKRLQEYLSVVKLPNITDEEEREIDEVGSTVHHRVWVRSYVLAHSFIDWNICL